MPWPPFAQRDCCRRCCCARTGRHRAGRTLAERAARARLRASRRQQVAALHRARAVCAGADRFEALVVGRRSSCTSTEVAVSRWKLQMGHVRHQRRCWRWLQMQQMLVWSPSRLSSRRDMVGAGIFYYLTENSKGYLLVTRAAETLSECVNISNKHVRKSPSKNLLSVHTYYSHLCSQWTCQAPVWACCGRLALVYSAPWARNRLVSTTHSSNNIMSTQKHIHSQS